MIGDTPKGEAWLKGIIAQLLIPKKDGKGRVVVNELLFHDGALPNIIREGAVHKIVSLIEGGRGKGMQLMTPCFGCTSLNRKQSPYFTRLRTQDDMLNSTLSVS